VPHDRDLVRVAHAMTGRLRREDGFTLPELLITISMSMIVALAAFGLLDTAIKRTGETQARVEATQRGRQALDQMTRQMRSQVCLSATVPAMVKASPLEAVFYVDLSDGSKPVAERIEKRVLVYEPAKARIMEHTYVATPGKSPTEFPVNPTRRRVLLENAAPGTWEDGRADTMFRYYAFRKATPPVADVELVSPSTTTDLGRIAQIELAFTAMTGKKTGAQAPRGSMELHDQVYMRAADPNDPAPFPTCA
jgi:type II secretory pathway pseudopilin PulG